MYLYFIIALAPHLHAYMYEVFILHEMCWNTLLLENIVKSCELHLLTDMWSSCYDLVVNYC